MPVTPVRAHRGEVSARRAGGGALRAGLACKHVGTFPALEDEMCDFAIGWALIGPLARPPRCAGVGGHRADLWREGKAAHSGRCSAVRRIRLTRNFDFNIFRMHDMDARAAARLHDRRWLRPDWQRWPHDRKSSPRFRS